MASSKGRGSLALPWTESFKRKKRAFPLIINIRLYSDEFQLDRVVRRRTAIGGISPPGDLLDGDLAVLVKRFWLIWCDSRYGCPLLSLAFSSQDARGWNPCLSACPISHLENYGVLTTGPFRKDFMWTAQSTLQSDIIPTKFCSRE